MKAVYRNGTFGRQITLEMTPQGELTAEQASAHTEIASAFGESVLPILHEFANRKIAQIQERFTDPEEQKTQVENSAYYIFQQDAAQEPLALQIRSLQFLESILDPDSRAYKRPRPDWAVPGHVALSYRSVTKNRVIGFPIDKLIHLDIIKAIDTMLAKLKEANLLEIEVDETPVPPVKKPTPERRDDAAPAARRARPSFQFPLDQQSLINRVAEAANNKTLTNEEMAIFLAGYYLGQDALLQQIGAAQNMMCQDIQETLNRLHHHRLQG